MFDATIFRATLATSHWGMVQITTESIRAGKVYYAELYA